MRDSRSHDFFAVNSDGQVISPLSSSAKKFCSVGTLIRQQHGVFEPEHTKSMKTQRKQCGQLVDQTLQSEEYDYLLTACFQWNFNSVTQMHDSANEEQFTKVWTLAILLAKSEE
jgi:hypothetical protein